MPQPTRSRPPRPTVILLNKPYRVLCQFRRHDARATLADFVPVPGVYPAGRLDFDSEGLVVLTGGRGHQHALADPEAEVEKVYLVQVEGVPDRAALTALAGGIRIATGITRPARARPIDEPSWLWPRVPPIRHRASVPTAWIELRLREGRNRQVRHMTAAVGHPTLRLVRVGVGPFSLGRLAPGEWREAEWEPPAPGGTARRGAAPPTGRRARRGPPSGEGIRLGSRRRLR